MLDDSDGRISSLTWITGKELVNQNPRWGAELLARCLDRARGDADTPPPDWFEKAFGADDYWAPTYLRILDNDGGAYIDTALPFVVSALEASEAPVDDEGLRIDRCGLIATSTLAANAAVRRCSRPWTPL